MAADKVRWLTPDWPAPSRVHALTTLRTGGVSQADFASLNLALHVNDDATAVAENRRRLKVAARLPGEPVWLNQVHGVDIVEADAQRSVPTADASVAHKDGQVCAIMTADCLPVLLCDASGSRIGAAHAGWRGLVAGVLAKTVAALDTAPGELLAWLGPAIEQSAFEVGGEVRDQFMAKDPASSQAFLPNARGRWQADLYELARQELNRLGITQIYGGGFQCFADEASFFSYRRNARTGRMATLIWLADDRVAADSAA